VARTASVLPDERFAARGVAALRERGGVCFTV
jgi:hypothetical protein